MRKRAYLVLALMLGVALLAACGGSDSGATGATGGGASGNIDNGKALFAQATIGSNPGCITCHSLDGSQLVGPSMQGIGTRAATSVQGESAQDYLHTSIVDPNAHVVEGFAQGVMPSYKDVLKESQLNDLVAYLSSLK